MSRFSDFANLTQRTSSPDGTIANRRQTVCFLIHPGCWKSSQQQLVQSVFEIPQKDESKTSRSDTYTFCPQIVCVFVPCWQYSNGCLLLVRATSTTQNLEETCAQRCCARWHLLN